MYYGQGFHHPPSQIKFGPIELTFSMPFTNLKAYFPQLLQFPPKFSPLLKSLCASNDTVQGAGYSATATSIALLAILLLLLTPASLQQQSSSRYSGEDTKDNDAGQEGGGRGRAGRRGGSPLHFRQGTITHTGGQGLAYSDTLLQCSGMQKDNFFTRARFEPK